ncbi:unnamed protein product [Lampetra fluviatilis]
MDPLCHRDHAAHEPSWTLAAVQRPGQQLQQQQQLQMCVACVLETLGDHNISVCRKTLALSRLLERLLQDGGGPLVSLLAAGNLAAAWSLVHNLTGMLTVLQDVPALNLVMEVLTQLTCRLKSEDVARALLAMVEKQVTGPAGPKQSLPFIALLGKLIDALPPLAERLAHHQAPLLEQLVALLRFPDEVVQVAAFYACRGACGGGTGGVTLEERFPARLLRTMCAATLATLGGAPGTELQFNALGLLRQLLRVAPLVSELMRPLPDLAREPSLAHAANDEASLPLILKKLLHSGEDTLRVASVQCMCCVLAQRPESCVATFLHADLPEFLFEALSSTNELLVWSIYCCLTHFVQHELFYSKCQSAYGIEPVLRSLQFLLKLVNVEAQKQGFSLLAEMLQRQPASIKIFPSWSTYCLCLSVVRDGVTAADRDVCSVAACALASFLRSCHLVAPVPYTELKELMNALLQMLREISPPLSHRMSAAHSVRAEGETKLSVSELCIIQGLQAFCSACRLVVKCSSEPLLRENRFAAPGGRGDLGSAKELEWALVGGCDSTCIPVAMRMYDACPSKPLALALFTCLDEQHQLCPSAMRYFSAKLASSGFIRATLEVKAAFCRGPRDDALNQACSRFLLRTCMSLGLLANEASPPTLPPPPPQAPLADGGEVVDALAHGLLDVAPTPRDCLLLLREPRADLTLRPAQLAAMAVLFTALAYADRLAREQEVSEALLNFLHHLGEGPPVMPASLHLALVRLALCLLALCQRGEPCLPADRLAPVVRAVRAADSPAELYSHRPSFVRFVFAHEDLAALLAPQVLRSWLGRLRPTLAARQAATASTELTDSTASVASVTSRASAASSSSSAAVAAVPMILDSGSSILEGGTDRGIEFLSGAEAMDERSHMAAMLAVLQKSLHAGRALLKLVCNGERGEAERALSLTRRWACAAACRSPTLLLLCSSLPDVLQRAAHGDVCNLPLMLGALCHLQLQGALDHSSEEVSFRLLYHVFRVVDRVKSAKAPVLLPAFSFVYASLGQGAGAGWGRNSGDSRAVALALSSERLLALLQEAVQPPVGDESPWPSPASPCESELLGSAWLLLSALLGCQAAHDIEVRGCIGVDPLVLLAPLTGKRGASGLLQVCALQLLKTLLGLGFASPLLRIRTAPAPSDAAASDVDASLRPLSLDHITHLAIALDRHLVQPQDALALAAASCLCALLEFTSERSGPVAHHLVSRAWFQKLPSNLATTVLMSCGNPSSALLLLSVLLRHEGIGGSGPLETQSFIEPLLRLVLQRSTSGLDPVTWDATVALLTQLVQSGRDTAWLQPREEWLRILRDPHPHQGAPTDLVSIGSVTVSLRHLAECTSCCDAERRAALLLPLLS